jgi:exosortase A-associated hydrolase 1
MRRHLLLDCAGDTLAATLDEAAGAVGLLIITGGNETRAGAFSGQSRLAARIAAAGYPVFRFDRRGTGDSTGDNRGFAYSNDDITAALATFRREQPQLRAVVGFGNCDAASALMLQGGSGCTALALANPWTFDAADEGPPPAVLRRRYIDKLKNPREVLRLLTGGVSLTKLAAGLKKAASGAQAPSSLVGQMQAGMAGYQGKVRFLLAANDRTAQAFMAACPQTVGHWQVCEGAGHSFADAASADWLFNQLLSVLEEQARQLNVG